MSAISRPWIYWAGLLLVLLTLKDGKLSFLNMPWLCSQVPLILLSISTALCLAMKRLDWSMGPTVYSASLCANLSYLETGSITCGVLGGVIFGLLTGMFNGCLIGRLRLHSLLVTLGMALLSEHFQILNKNWISAPQREQHQVQALETWSNIIHHPSSFIALTLSFLIFLALFLVFLGRSNLLLYAVAIGSDERQTWRLPEKVSVVIFSCYLLQGFVAGIAGVMFSWTQPYLETSQHGHGLSLAILSSCLLGGMSFEGSRPHFPSLTCGIGIVITGGLIFEHFGLGIHHQGAVQSIILVMALIFHRYQRQASASKD